LSGAGNKQHLRAGMIQDAAGAVRRLIEVHGHGDSARATDGEIGGMPFRTIWGEEADAVAGFHAEFNERIGQASDAAEKLLRRNSLPAPVAAHHLGAGRRVVVDGPKESQRERWIVHAIFECTLVRNLVQYSEKWVVRDFPVDAITTPEKETALVHPNLTAVDGDRFRGITN